MQDPRSSRARALLDYSRAHPVLVCLYLYAIAVFLRYLDIFVTGLAEEWGEAFLHKALGFLLVLAYLWLVRKTLPDIGLHSRNLGRALAIGAIPIVVMLVVAYGVQMLVSSGAGEDPSLVWSAIDPKGGLSGGASFAVLLVVGNVVNSFMEEGLFRGVMLKLLRVRFSVWRANFVQAALFSLWHIAWPIYDYSNGKIELDQAVGDSVFIMAGTLVSGLVFGYLYLKTDSLWAPWIAHFINNTTMNLLHIQTASGLDEGIPVFFAIVGLGTLAVILWTKLVADRMRLPQVVGWEAAA